MRVQSHGGFELADGLGLAAHLRIKLSEHVMVEAAVGLQLGRFLRVGDSLSGFVEPFERQGHIVKIEVVLRTQLHRLLIVLDGILVVPDAQVQVAEKIISRTHARVELDRLLDEGPGSRRTVELGFGQPQHQTELDRRRDAIDSAFQQGNGGFQFIVVEQPSAQIDVILQLVGSEVNGLLDLVHSRLLPGPLCRFQKQGPQAIVGSCLIRLQARGLEQRSGCSLRLVR